MRLRFCILVLVGLCHWQGFSKTFTCPSPYVFMDGGAFIKVYDPALPLSATNPSNTNIPTFGGGLTLMPNINGGTLTPTFYTTSGGTYWYWSGVAWVNTNHSTGNSAAVNIAGCAGAIYNLVGSSGAVYVYNGTSNGTLLTTLQGFNGGGPYDLQTDCNCNFYALNTSSPNQTLTMYSPTGSPMCTYTMSGMPNTSAGGGFAIVGNTIFVKNNIGNPGGFYVGTISGSSISFTTVSGFTNSPGDFASCPTCQGQATLTGANLLGGMLGCNTPTTALTAIATATGTLMYNWQGPGITSGNTNSVLVVNQPGNYSVTISAGGCPPQSVMLSTSVFNNSVVVPASISPSGNVCIPFGSSLQLAVAHTYTNDVVLWYTPNVVAPIFNDTIIASTPGIYTVQVVDPFTGCTGVDHVTLAITPTVNLASSDFTLCGLPTGGSPATITLAASGASNYTFMTSSNFGLSNPNGPVTTASVLNGSGNLSSVASVTLLGKTGLCSHSVTGSYSIVANPTITVPAATFSICPGGTQSISLSGADTYTWTGPIGLNTYSGSSVVATPSTTSVYQVSGSSDLCKSTQTAVTVVVMPIPTLNISPSNSVICLGNSVNLFLTTNASSYTWSPGTGLSSVNNTIVAASPPFTQLYNVLVDLNGCVNTSTALIQVVNPPLVNLSLNSASMCAFGFNNSVNSLTMSASGASSYTLTAPGFVGINPVNGPLFSLTPIGAQLATSNVFSLNLTAVSGVCTVNKTQTIMIVPNPSVSISPLTANICPGKTQAYSSNGAFNYFWQSGSSYTVTSPNAIVATSPGTSYYAVFGESYGCYSDTKVSVLLINPVPTVAISQPVYTVCAGNSVSLTALGNGSTYNWSPSAFLSPAFGTVATANTPISQNFTVLATSNSCTNQAVTTVSVITNPIISAFATEPIICQGMSTQISVNGALSYQWFPSAGLNQPSGNLVIASPLKNTTYSISGFNGIYAGTTTVDVTVLNGPDLNIWSDGPFVCEGGRTTLYTSGAQFYEWSPSGSVFLAPGDSVAVVVPAGNTSYTVIGSTKLGTVTCSSKMSYSVIVVPYPVPEISSDVQICEGQKVTIKAKGGNTYSWTPSDGLSGTEGAAVVASPSITTVYSVDVSYNGACAKGATMQINVVPSPTVFASPDTTYRLDEVMLVHAVGNGSLTWIQGEGIVCNDCPETRVYATHNGCYIVQAQDENGCLATDKVCLEIIEDFSVYLPNSFTPNKDGINDVFLVYGESISQVKMSIYDRWGVKIFYSEDVFKGWDGTTKGTDCQQDVYTYVISYYGLDRKFYTKTGHVNLLR